MPINSYFDQIFANAGTRATVPDAAQSNGSVSYNQGYGVNYTLPPGNASALNIEQNKFNQLIYDITAAIQYAQQWFAPVFITSTMNGGTAYSYPQNAIVNQSGTLYVSLVNSNTTTPPSSSWSVYTPGVTANIGLSRSNLKGAWVSNTTATWTAVQLVLQNSSQASQLLTSYSQTLNSATTGAGGLDTGTLAASAWYYVYAIYGTGGTSIIMSASSTAPTLPTGYTSYALIGAVRTDSSSHLIGFTQANEKWRYSVGNNLTVLPAFSSGAVSSAVSVTNFCPVAITSQAIVVLFASQNSQSNINVYSSAAAASSGSNSSISGASGAPTSASSWCYSPVVLESSSVYLAAATNTSSSFYGFDINF